MLQKCQILNTIIFSSLTFSLRIISTAKSVLLTIGFFLSCNIYIRTYFNTFVNMNVFTDYASLKDFYHIRSHFQVKPKSKIQKCFSNSWCKYLKMQIFYIPCRTVWPYFLVTGAPFSFSPMLKLGLKFLWYFINIAAL